LRELWPREHGATVALVLPLASVPIVAAGASWRFAAFCLAALAAFVAHEPALIWMGRRGSSRARALVPIARPALVVLALIAALAGGAALASAPLQVWLACIPPFVTGAFVFLLALRGAERNLAGELLALLALAALDVPAALLAGLSLPSALQLALAWGIALGLGTWAARSVLIRKKDGGRGLRLATIVAAASVALAAMLIWRGVIGPWLALGPFTFAGLIVVLACTPPSPKHMTRLGVGLTAASLLTLVGVVAALR